MAMRGGGRWAWALAAALGGCAPSGAGALAEALRHAASDAASARFVLEALAARRVPRAYARETLRQLAQSVPDVAKRVRGAHDAPPAAAREALSDVSALAGGLERCRRALQAPAAAESLAAGARDLADTERRLRALEAGLAP